jgi:hypothetical protein
MLPQNRLWGRGQFSWSCFQDATAFDVANRIDWKNTDKKLQLLDRCKKCEYLNGTLNLILDLVFMRQC